MLSILELLIDVGAKVLYSQAGRIIVIAVLSIFVAFTQHSSFAGLAPPVMILLFAATLARDVQRGRAALWQAACLDLDDEEQRPEHVEDSVFIAPAALSLHKLAVAIDHGRRGRYLEAMDLLPRIDKKHLRADEMRLLEAVKALISVGLGDGRNAARRSIVALPTGSDDLDMALGRVVLADAWNAPARLQKITNAWSTSGNAGAALGRLSRLGRLRLAPESVARLRIDEARELSEEARAVGDDGLASELEAQCRHQAYR